MDTQVLVVGAGPTGLMLANQLARRGVTPLIIDRHSGPAQQTRAMAVHARTLEIYDKLGVAGEALALGAKGVAANMWTNGRWSARIPIGDIGQELSPYPFVLMLGQDDNERILGAHLERLGVKISWNTELVALTQHHDQVTATLRSASGEERIMRAAWVCGADGSRSAVRELNGIGFPGEPYQHTFFVADTEATGSMKPAELNVYLWRDGFHLFFPMRGTDRWRVIGILPAHLRGRDDVSFEDVRPAIQQEAGTDLTFRRCLWFSTYHIHHRAAEKFRAGRCFLAGDAAHIHSPAGGQGMNTGLQDAYNLAWKLALVVQGRAAPALLDSYEQERLPVARQLLETTDRAFQLVVSDGWFARLIRTQIMARVASRAMTIERVRKVAFRTISQIGISYPDSPLSQNLVRMPEGAPRAGERFPWFRIGPRREDGSHERRDLFAALDDAHFNLVVFGEPSCDVSQLEPAIAVHVLPQSASVSEACKAHHIPFPSYALVRPDGHIGLSGAELDLQAISAYLQQRVRFIAGVVKV